MKRWWAVVPMLLGAALGLAGDLLSGARISLAALPLAPFVIPVSGGMISISALRLPVFVVGVLFWPGLAFLLVRWNDARSWRWLMALFGWCAVGFFQLGERTAGVLSA